MGGIACNICLLVMTIDRVALPTIYFDKDH